VDALLAMDPEALVQRYGFAFVRGLGRRLRAHGSGFRTRSRYRLGMRAWRVRRGVAFSLKFHVTVVRRTLK
jgi:hypothetical protein